MASGMNGGNSNEENSFYCYGYSVRQNTVQRVVVLGEPPSQVTVQGYANIGCKEKLDSVTGKVKVQAMLFSELIRDCMVEYLAKSGVEKISPLVTDEKAYRAVVSMFRYTALGEEPVHRYSGINLGLLIREAYSVERVMYLKTQLTIPAGQSVKLESRFPKNGSYDFGRMRREKDKDIWSYDMMTRLGSGLDFTVQKASLDLPQIYEIARQNFGFDIAKNITEVTLNLNEERYYLEIRRKR